MGDCLLMFFQERLGTRNTHLLPNGHFEQLNCKFHLSLIHLAHSAGRSASPRSPNTLRQKIDMIKLEKYRNILTKYADIQHKIYPLKTTSNYGWDISKDV